jgi:hypothetical protein
VPKSEIDELYFVRPYYIVPDGKVGHDAYAVIRETIRNLDKVALARVVLTNREHVIAVEARDKGLMGMLLRYPYEVRGASEYFDDIQDVKITKDMLDLAKHIVEQKSGHFDPAKFEDHYEAALSDLLQKKQNGQPIAKITSRTSGNVIDIIDALRASLKDGRRAPAAKPPRRPQRKPRSPSPAPNARRASAIQQRQETCEQHAFRLIDASSHPLMSTRLLPFLQIGFWTIGVQLFLFRITLPRLIALLGVGPVGLLARVVRRSFARVLIARFLAQPDPHGRHTAVEPILRLG